MLSNDYSIEKTTMGIKNTDTPTRPMGLAGLTRTALSELIQCIDMAEDILSRGFGVDPGPRPGKEIKTLADATEQMAEEVLFLHDKIASIMSLMFADDN